MDKTVIARIGVEGGGVTIYGSHLKGVWTFWTEGTSMDLDENDDEVWRSWSSEPVTNLELALPNDWPLFHPVEIHPDFVEWFRVNYENARASLPVDQRQYQGQDRHPSWLAVRGMPR
jgi:hypothetical protein